MCVNGISSRCLCLCNLGSGANGSWKSALVRRPRNSDLLRKSTVDCVGIVIGEDLVEGKIAGEYLGCMGWNEGIGISAMNGTGKVPIDEVDNCGSWEMEERHVIKDDPIVYLGIISSKVVHASDEQGVLKAVDGPLRLSCAGWSVDEDSPKLARKGERPDR